MNADARKAEADGNISVGSTLAASATALVEGNSLSFSIGKALSAPVATATIAPRAATPASMVSSSISGGNIVSTKGDINVKSIYNQDLSVEGTYAVLLGSGAEATSYSRSGSFIATGGATAIATETPYLESWVDSDATLRAGHAIAVIASSATTPVATAAGQNGGFVGLGESHAYATGSPIVKARMDGTIGSAAGLIAGGNIIIEDVDGATVGGVAGLTPTTIAVRARTDLLGTGGHIDVNVDNWVVLTETTGDLLVGLVQSRGGDVALTATDASILDALNDLPSDVTGVNITLRAPGGTGTYMSRLEFNWSDPAAGLLRATVNGVTWFTFSSHGTTGAILDAGRIHLR